jgi:hypothetical protein
MALILCRQVDLRSVPRLSLELSENSFQRAHFSGFPVPWKAPLPGSSQGAGVNNHACP